MDQKRAISPCIGENHYKVDFRARQRNPRFHHDLPAHLIELHGEGPRVRSQDLHPWDQHWVRRADWSPAVIRTAHDIEGSFTQGNQKVSQGQVISRVRDTTHRNNLTEW